LPHAVLDGNVFRVLSRVFGIETPIDSTDWQKTISAISTTIIRQKEAFYTQSGNYGLWSIGVQTAKSVV
jgi:A/G-specific adenine glycosylase